MESLRQMAIGTKSFFAPCKLGVISDDGRSEMARILLPDEELTVDFRAVQKHEHTKNLRKRLAVLSLFVLIIVSGLACVSIGFLRAESEQRNAVSIVHSPNHTIGQFDKQQDVQKPTIDESTDRKQSVVTLEVDKPQTDPKVKLNMESLWNQFLNHSIAPSTEPQRWEGIPDDISESKWIHYDTLCVAKSSKSCFAILSHPNRAPSTCEKLTAARIREDYVRLAFNLSSHSVLYDLGFELVNDMCDSVPIKPYQQRLY